MPSRKDIVAGQAAVFVTLRDKLFRDGVKNMSATLNQVGRSLTQIGTGLTAFGVGITAPLLRATQVFTEYGDAIDKASARTGIGAETLSGLGFAAEQSGSNVQTLEKVLLKMQANVLDAATGVKTANEALQLMKLNVNDLIGLTPEEQFFQIADGIARIEDPTIRAAAAMEILGRGGQKLVPLFAGGSAGIRELIDEAKALGITVNQSEAAGAAQMADAWNRAKQSLRGVQVSIGSALAPAITSLANFVAGVQARVVEWIRNNQQLVQGLAVAGAVVTGLGAGLTALGVSLTVATIGLSGLSAAAAGIPLIGGAIAALLSPLGLVGAALAAAGVAMFAFTQTGREMASTIFTAFVAIKDTVVDTMGAVIRAIGSGDLLGAARAAWNGIREAASEAWLTVRIVTLQAVESIRQSFPGLVANITQVWNDLVSVTTKAWNLVTDVVSNVWGTVTSFVVEAWRGVVDGVSGLTEGMTGGLFGYFGQINDYWSDITDGMFASWADFTAGVKRIWIDAGTLILTTANQMAIGLLQIFEKVSEFLSGDGFITQSLREAQRQIEEFNALVVQGSDDRHAAVERERQARLVQVQEIQQRQQTSFSERIAELQSQLAQATADKIKIPDVQDVARQGTQDVLDGLDLEAPELKVQTTGDFSAAAAAIVGANQARDPGVRQRNKMVDLLNRIVENTGKTQQLEAV